MFATPDKLGGTNRCWLCLYGIVLTDRTQEVNGLAAVIFAFINGVLACRDGRSIAMERVVCSRKYSEPACAGSSL